MSNANSHVARASSECRLCAGCVLSTDRPASHVPHVLCSNCLSLLAGPGALASAWDSPNLQRQQYQLIEYIAAQCRRERVESVNLMVMRIVTLMIVYNPNTSMGTL